MLSGCPVAMPRAAPLRQCVYPLRNTRSSTPNKQTHVSNFPREFRTSLYSHFKMDFKNFGKNLS